MFAVHGTELAVILTIGAVAVLTVLILAPLYVREAFRNIAAQQEQEADQ